VIVFYVIIPIDFGRVVFGALPSGNGSSIETRFVRDVALAWNKSASAYNVEKLLCSLRGR